MAGAGLNITIVGGSELSAALEKLGKSLMEFGPTFEELGHELVDFYSGQVFASQGGAIGEHWTPLTNTYAVWKARNWPGRTLLIESGTLQNSFTFTSTATWLMITNSDDIFKYHQLGTVHMPARVMLKLDEQRKAVIQTAIAAAVREKIDGVMRI